MSESNSYKTVNAWNIYGSPEHQEALDACAKAYIAFLSACKTERETVDAVADKLRQAGFTEDFQGDKVFRVCRGKALFAARKGAAPLKEGIRLISAHTDSPRLDLKQRPLLEQVEIGQAKTHYYGGIHKYQWLARPLALHGVVVRESGERVVVTLGEDPAEPVFTISDLLPHLAKKQEAKTVADAFEAEKLNLIMGHRPKAEDIDEQADENKKKLESPIKAQMLDLLSAKYGISEEDLMSAELQVVPAGAARPVGLDGSLIGGYGQDDRICVYAAVEALLDADTPHAPAAIILWDKEEIGSEGSTGAQSTFLEYCLKDLAEAWTDNNATTPTRFRDFIVRSKAISADVHGALDPDWQELHEKQNSALIGHGPCFCKFTGSRGKYGANDAHPEYVAWLRGVMNERGIPWQMAELGKVDAGGGGTVALYLSAYGMDVIDCGPALLGMHSPFELASKVDLYASKLAYQAFFESL